MTTPQTRMTNSPASAVPVIDMAPLFGGEMGAKRQVAKAIADACRDVGFFCVTCKRRSNNPSLKRPDYPVAPE